MHRLLQTIGSAWAWLGIAVVIILWFPTMVLVYLVTVPFDKGRYVIGWWFRRLGVAMATVNPYWRFSRTGLRVADPRRPYVVVSNHESFADILLISHLPFEMKWLSKVEILGIPLIGWMMRMAGDIPIKRGFGPSAAEAMERCRASLRNRVSVIFFPEGTRSIDGNMLPFKDGAFRLAIEAGVPILPVAVWGVEQIGPNWRRLRRTDVNLRVGEFIHLPPGDARSTQLDQDTDLIMRTIAAMLPEQYRGVYK